MNGEASSDTNGGCGRWALGLGCLATALLLALAGAVLFRGTQDDRPVDRTADGSSATEGVSAAPVALELELDPR